MSVRHRIQCDDGGLIDIAWSNENKCYSLLINIPANAPGRQEDLFPSFHGSLEAIKQRLAQSGVTLPQRVFEQLHIHDAETSFVYHQIKDGIHMRQQRL